MIDAVSEKAYAKLNISLDVTGKRPDGYHDMVMVMQTVSLCDDMEICRVSDDGVRSTCNLRFIPEDDRNLAVKAAKRYLSAVGDTEQGIRISISKHIPVGAGMGGGSADAAAVLRGMNRMYGNALSRNELEKIASDIGSDVAFCVYGGTMLAAGRGEVLTPLPDMPECSIVICKPEFSVSTPELFKKLDRCKIRNHPDTAGLTEALERGDLPNVCRRMYNVFEDVDDRRMRTVSAMKSRLQDLGALGAIMTGTGSAVFGVFDSKDKAAAANEELKKEVGFCTTAECVKRM